MTPLTGQAISQASVIPFPTPRPAEEKRPRLLLSPPHLAGDELEELRATIDSGWLAPAGPALAAFEGQLSAVLGMPHVVALASGTAALHLGFHLLGIQPGDEVWAPSLTFIATVAPAVQMGATPRFLDVDPATWTLDPALLRAELSAAARRGRLPRAVVTVDLYGQPADMQAITAACAEWGVPVLSDSAESLGSVQRGGHAGLGARLAAFSFNGNKIVTCGGGGALASEDPWLIAQARRLAAQSREDSVLYQHETTGFSYGMSSVLASVGLAQLRRLPERVAARRAVHERYREALSGVAGLSFTAEPGWARGNRWLTVLSVDPAASGTTREALREALAAEGIESRPVFKPLHLQPAFRDAPRAGGEVAAALFENGLCLPSGSQMTAQDQGRVITVIRRACGR
ncbi:aminotransferase DegT [Rhodovarius crocodyli]|uniref:Aminotransferase DegT n=1 Tax=Rhodovarius crocodyli TaxID=1979269 RepID=A0A437MIE4_9PROT|nr:DegT/DnrJ/EryC1/StrS family aminotransferase [Rhodovarius crocodyli]RVT97427.1 aminotransferase DegT [Rhodovarius crocodyli]